MARMTSIGPKEMIFHFWLVFDKSGNMRFTRTEPSCARDERRMSCAVNLPTALFKTPELRATVKIEDPGTAPFTIDVTAAGDALKGALGVDIDFRVENPS